MLCIVPVFMLFQWQGNIFDSILCRILDECSFFLCAFLYIVFHTSQDITSTQSWKKKLGIDRINFEFSDFIYLANWIAFVFTLDWIHLIQFLGIRFCIRRVKACMAQNQTASKLLCSRVKIHPSPSPLGWKWGTVQCAWKVSRVSFQNRLISSSSLLPRYIL